MTEDTRGDGRETTDGGARGTASPPDDLQGKKIEELKRLIDTGASGEGISESPYPGLIYYRTTSTESRRPAVADASVCIVASGEKQALLGDEVHTYDPLHYRVLTVPMPFEVAVTEASEEVPLRAVILDLDPVELTEVLLEMEDSGLPLEEEDPARGIYTSPLEDELLGAVNRLVRAVADDRRREVLAPLAEREILVHLLSGEQGARLRAVAQQNSRSQRVARALRFIRDHYDESLDVPTIAQAVHMAPSTLHHHFKEVTSTSPIQYLKKIRLHQARRLMYHGDRTASAAGKEVGYESPSHFSRDFRRHFGEPPVQHVKALREAEKPLV